MKVSWGYEIPNWMENTIHVPNHQPAKFVYCFFGEHDDKPISAPHVSYLLSDRISWNLFLGYHGIIRGIRCGIISWGEPGFTCFISTFLVGGIPTPEKWWSEWKSVGVDGNSQLFLESHQIPWFQSPPSSDYWPLLTIINHHYPILNQCSSHHQPDILLFQLLTIINHRLTID